MRKPAFCVCENKGADQLQDKCAADLLLYFHYLVLSLYFLNLKPYSLGYVRSGLNPEDMFSSDATHILLMFSMLSVFIKSHGNSNGTNS